jgi:hypothetical protein
MPTHALSGARKIRIAPATMATTEKTRRSRECLVMDWLSRVEMRGPEAVLASNVHRKDGTCASTTDQHRHCYAYRYLSRRTAGKTVRPRPHLHNRASAYRPITIAQPVPKLRRHTRYRLMQIKAGVDCATQMESRAHYSSGNLNSRQLQPFILSQSDISLRIRFVRKPCALKPRTPRRIQPYLCDVRCKAVPLYLAKENQ